MSSENGRYVRWGSPADYIYESGDLYVGKDLKHQHEIGVTTKRHALTVAGSRSGKGAAVIIPNLLRWPDSALVIDPKGEAAEETAQYREDKFGIPSHVLDPFKMCNIPERLRARFNPLDEIDPTSLTSREDINVLADGMTMRSDPKAAFWDDGSEAVLAGFIAHVVSRVYGPKRNLIEVRRHLNLPTDEFANFIDSLVENEACGRLPIEAYNKLKKSGKEAAHYLSGAETNTKWLNSPAMESILSDSTFKLSDLKTKKCTVYLVIDPDYLAVHNRFLRLFVRTALSAMAKGGGRKNPNRCLFLLDEFFSLGRIETINKASGLMPGYGVHLWPILQDLGQLYDLYDRNAAQGFIGNADLLQFFGLSDEVTPDFVSRRLGNVETDQLPPPPMAPCTTMNGGLDFFIKGASQEDYTNRKAHDDSLYQTQMNDWQHEARVIGRPRMSQDEITQCTKVPDNGVIAKNQICFIKNEPFLLRPTAHFFDYAPAPPPVQRPKEPDKNPYFALFGQIADLAFDHWRNLVTAAICMGFVWLSISHI